MVLADAADKLTMNGIGRKIIALSFLGGALSAQTVSGVQPVIEHPISAKAELAEMVTDRPDFTESTKVVGKGVIQIENGFTRERSPDGSNMSGPELLLRVGLGKRLEFRIGGDGFLSQRMPGKASVVGYSDVEVAAKIVLVEQGRHRPALSLIPLVSAPAGSPFFSSGGWDPTLKVALGKDLPKGFGLGGNANFASLNTLQGRFFQTAWSASLGHSLGHGFGAYWEVFGFAPWDKGSSAASWNANTGVTRSIGKNAQVDARIGRRLTDTGTNWFWGMGLAVRQSGWASFFRRVPATFARGRGPDPEERP
jgi:hypothetical protein